MNDTNVSKLPDGWTRRRLRFDARINPVKSEVKLPDDTEVSFVPMDAVGELGGLRLDQTRELADVYTGCTYFADGDVCVAKITPCFENGKGALAQGLTNGVAFGTTELHVLRPSGTLDARFLFYLTIAHDFRNIGEAEMLGAGGQKRVPEAFLRDWRPLLPRIEVQRRIANFLDEKTAQIDALIDKKRALLERLTEQRQALITRAVTHGLNPDVPMKPSGVDWLNEIPADWNIKPLRYLGNVILGLTYKPDDVSADDQGILVLRASNISKGRLVHADNVFVDIAVPRNLICKNGDLVICSRNGSRHLIGKCGVVSEDWVGCTFGAFMTVVRSEFSDWLELVLSSSLFEFQAGRYMSTTINQLTASTLKSFPVPLPPYRERRHIVYAVHAANEQVDAVIIRAEKSISYLVESRSALITAAITGQLSELNG